MPECGCCYSAIAANKLVQCAGADNHSFCVSCMQRYAEAQIGLGKHELSCPAMDGCSATFSHTQREKFLDEGLTKAIDRLEMEAVLNIANVAGLTTCPFCPYAAEYPEIVQGGDTDFYCQRPGCLEVSCRLCKRTSHQSKTCQEAAKGKGKSARKNIEEAMSDAMIRRCNKCDTPFIRSDGCNKMKCPKSDCRNIQCYVCGKSCDYNHFGTRGCPLFDNVEARHENEIREAQKVATKQAIKENPGVDVSRLRFKMSAGVKEDDDRRHARNERPDDQAPPEVDDEDWLPEEVFLAERDVHIDEAPRRHDHDHGRVAGDNRGARSRGRAGRHVDERQVIELDEPLRRREAPPPRREALHRWNGNIARREEWLDHDDLHVGASDNGHQEQRRRHRTDHFAVDDLGMDLEIRAFERRRHGRGFVEPETRIEVEFERMTLGGGDAWEVNHSHEIFRDRPNGGIQNEFTLEINHYRRERIMDDMNEFIFMDFEDQYWDMRFP